MREDPMTEPDPLCEPGKTVGPKDAPPRSAGSSGPLEGLRVLDVSTLFAGPLAATFLGDFGADVTKIEHPSRPDAARGHGTSKNGVGLWFKTLGRNKRLATLDLSQGREVFLELVRANDVLVENFR